MQTILVFIYAMVRFFFKFEKSEYSEIWGRIGVALAGYAIGLCMAAFLFLPNAVCFLSSARTEDGEPFSFLYRLNYYMKFFWELSPLRHSAHIPSWDLLRQFFH